MNTKTTLVLALVAAAVACYVLLVDKPWEAPKAEVEPKSTAVALFESKFDDADRVEVQRRMDGKKLVFAKDPEEKTWKMLEPMKASATEYQVKQFIDQVAQIKYLRKFGPNDVERPKDTINGLDKPVATVRIAKGDKELANVTVGLRTPTGKGNYVRVNADMNVKVGDKTEVVTAKDVLEAQADLSNTFNTKIADIRDKNVLKFELNDVKRMKVEGDRNFVLVKNGDNWVMESPVRSRADKSKAEGVVRAMTSLYVTEFKDDAPPGYKPYGLDPARLTVTVETEKKIPPKAKPGDPNTKPADIEESVKQAKYVLQVGGAADSSSNKQYFARLGDQPTVFSIGDHTYKQLNTDITDLQDKKIATINTANVKTIKTDTVDGSATLTRKEQGKWVDAEGKSADAIAVEDLLKSVNNLQAVNFVDPQQELVKMNWDQPRARITVTEEGSLNPVTVLVGPASASGKMVFVKNAAEEPVAAVHDDAVAPLLAGPVSYRDRSVMRFDRSRANKIEIAQTGKDPVTLTQKSNEWSMTAPVAATADRDAVRNLTQDISALQAKRVVGTGDKAKFGLDSPAVSLAVYIEPLTANPNVEVVGNTATKPAEPAAAKPAAATKPESTVKPASTQPATTRPSKTLAEQIKQIEELLEYQKTNPKENPLATDMLKKRLAELKAQAASQPAEAAAAAPAASKPAAVVEAPANATAASKPAEPTVLRLKLAQKDGKTYGMVDGNEMIYEVDNQVFTDATAELHDRQIVKFETPTVGEVEFVNGQTGMTFRKGGEDWKYAADPVLPIDKDKVTKALDELKDIKTHRYVSYKADLAQYGLDAPAKKFSVIADAKQVKLLVSAKGPENDPDKSVYAAVEGQGKVFLLKPDQVTKLTRKLDEFEKSAASPAPAGAMPGGGSM